MVIQHNISALNSHRNLSVNNSATSKNLEKLSSGFRINRAGDDAAGLAISEKMRGQIRGLAMAEQNASNGVSLIQTAEGGLNESHAILQRMRELAVQASNGTYQADDRAQIELEFQAVKSEIDRIASSTSYNGINLLDGSMGGRDVADMATVLGSDFGIGGTDPVFAAVAGGVTIADFEGVDVTMIVRDDAAKSVAIQVGDKTYTSAGAIKNDGSATMFVDQEGNNAFEITFANGTDVPTDAGVVTKLTMDNTNNLVSTADTKVAGAGEELTFQIGANGGADQRVGLHVGNMSSGNIGDATKGEFVASASVATLADANKAIETLDAAINQVSSQRAGLGAMQNRLEHTINNLGVTKENLTAAESTIRDVDMAKEMMEFTKNNILVQASQSMLAQANQLPQGVLSLLR